MATQTRQAASRKDQASHGQGRASKPALCFELETMAVKGRSATCDLLQNLLEERSLNLDRKQFCRYALEGSTACCLPDLLKELGGARRSPDKLADELRQALEMFYASDEAVLNPGLERLLKSACEASIPLAAVSNLPEKQALALNNHLGLDDLGVRVFAFEEETPCFPGIEIWLQAAKILEISPRAGLALVSSETACRGALGAGMRCVAIPDTFTSFQDFGGAQMVLETLDDRGADEVMALLEA